MFKIFIGLDSQPTFGQWIDLNKVGSADEVHAIGQQLILEKHDDQRADSYSIQGGEGHLNTIAKDMQDEPHAIEHLCNILWEVQEIAPFDTPHIRQEKQELALEYIAKWGWTDFDPHPRDLARQAAALAYSKLHPELSLKDILYKSHGTHPDQDFKEIFYTTLTTPYGTAIFKP